MIGVFALCKPSKLGDQQTADVNKQLRVGRRRRKECKDKACKGVSNSS